MKRFFQKVDIHILYIEGLLLIGAAAMPHRVWVRVILAVIPQGRILTRAFIDYPAFKQPAGGYVVTNEAVVAVAMALCLVLWRIVF